MSSPIPQEISQPDPKTIAIQWRDGHQSRFGARDLRILCPCANCVHEITQERLLKPETIPEGLFAKDIQLVGRYGVEFFWSDGHSSGIYTYEFLKKNCPCPACTALN